MGNFFWGHSWIAPFPPFPTAAISQSYSVVNGRVVFFPVGKSPPSQPLTTPSDCNGLRLIGVTRAARYTYTRNAATGERVTERRQEPDKENNMKIRIYYKDTESNQHFDDYRNAIGITMSHNYNELIVLLGNRTVKYQLTHVFRIEDAWYLEK